MQRRFFQTAVHTIPSPAQHFSRSMQAGTLGAGVSVRIPTDVDSHKVWKALLISIKQPQLFLAAKKVITSLTADGNGTRREMILERKRVVENIYANEATREIRYQRDGTPIETIHAIITDASSGLQSVEVYQRNSADHSRIDSHDSRVNVMNSLEKVFDMARKI